MKGDKGLTGGLCSVFIGFVGTQAECRKWTYDRHFPAGKASASAIFVGMNFSRLFGT
jgi:hypothetical protein